MEDLAKLIGALIILAAVSAATWLLESFWFMIAIGNIRRDWLHNLPPLGYQGSLPIAFAVSAFLGLAVATSVAAVVKRSK